MAMGRPIVSTTLGVEGLHVSSGEHLLIADTPNEFSNAMCDLSANEERRSRLVSSSLEMVRSHYSTPIVAKQFESICNSTIENHDSSNRKKGL